MKAYIIKYKGRVPHQWGVCAEDDYHECDSEDCCYTGGFMADAGVPIYFSMSDALHTLKWQKWELIAFVDGKPVHVNSYMECYGMKQFGMETAHMSLSETMKHLKERGFTIRPITFDTIGRSRAKGRARKQLSNKPYTITCKGQI